MASRSKTRPRGVAARTVAGAPDACASASAADSGAGWDQQSTSFWDARWSDEIWNLDDGFGDAADIEFDDCSVRRAQLKQQIEQQQKRFASLKKTLAEDGGGGGDDDPEDGGDDDEDSYSGSRSSRRSRQRSRRTEPKWRSGAAPEVPGFSAALGNHREFDIWVRRLGVYKKLCKPYLPPEKQALRVLNAVSGDPAQEHEVERMRVIHFSSDRKLESDTPSRKPVTGESETPTHPKQNTPNQKLVPCAYLDPDMS